MKRDIKRITWECEVRQTNKHETTLSPDLLQLLSVPEQAWFEIDIDFIKSLPPSNGHNTIIVLVDYYKKYGHFIVLGHPLTAQKVAQLFMSEVFKLHGLSKNIVPDQDPLFLSSFQKSLSKLNSQLQLFLPPPNQMGKHRYSINV